MISDDPLALLSAAIDEQRWNVAVELLEAHWSSRVHGHPAVLLDALDRLPDSVLDERPRWIRARDFLRSRSSLEAPAPAEDERAQLLRATAVVVELRRADRARESLAGVRRARALLEGLGPAAGRSVDPVRSELHYQWARALEEAGATGEAIDEYEAAIRAAPLTPDPARMLTLAGGAAALLAAYQGERARATGFIAVARTGSGPADPLSGAVSAALAEAFLRFDELEREEARRIIAAVDPIAVGHRWAPYFHLRASLEWERQQCRHLALELQARLDTLPHPPSETQRGHLGITRYLLFAAEGRMDRAHEALGPDTSTGTLLQQFTTALHAQDLVHLGRRSDARHLLTALRRERLPPRAELLALVVAPERSAADLERTASLAAEHRLFWLLTVLPEADRREVARLLEGRGGSANPAIEPSAALTPSPLTPRERDVGERAALGESVAGIAEALHVSVNTVKSQLRSVYRKLGVASRSELYTALQHGGRDPAERLERSS